MMDNIHGNPLSKWNSLHKVSGVEIRIQLHSYISETYRVQLDEELRIKAFYSFCARTTSFLVSPSIRLRLPFYHYFRYVSSLSSLSLLSLLLLPGSIVIAVPTVVSAIVVIFQLMGCVGT